MSDGKPEGNDPLSPYFPARTPSLPTTGSGWMALVLLGVLLFGVAVWLLRLVWTLGPV